MVKGEMSSFLEKRGYLLYPKRVFPEIVVF